MGNPALPGYMRYIESQNKTKVGGLKKNFVDIQNFLKFNENRILLEANYKKF